MKTTTTTRKMADLTEKRTTEIKGGKIAPFAGKRETLENFWKQSDFI